MVYNLEILNNEGEKMIDVKEAIKSARSYLTEIYSSAEYSGLLLEEIETSDDEKYWFITFSFYVKDSAPGLGMFTSASQVISGLGDYKRVYKVITIDRRDGKCLAIKIRQLND